MIVNNIMEKIMKKKLEEGNGITWYVLPVGVAGHEKYRKQRWKKRKKNTKMTVWIY